LQCHSVTPRALASCIQHPQPRRVICFPQPLVDITIVQSLHCHFTTRTVSGRHGIHICIFKKKNEIHWQQLPRSNDEPFKGTCKKLLGQIQPYSVRVDYLELSYNPPLVIFVQRLSKINLSDSHPISPMSRDYQPSWSFQGRFSPHLSGSRKFFLIFLTRSLSQGPSRRSPSIRIH
jgi:hypothetical protein